MSSACSISHKPLSGLSIAASSHTSDLDSEFSPNDYGLLWYWQHWKWEAVACFFVIATPLCSLATVFTHAGASPPWPFRISVNAIISIYALIFKGCLALAVASGIGQLQWTWYWSNRSLYEFIRYQNAAQNPWGALQLFKEQNIRQPLTSFGGTVLILSIKIDPLVQLLTSVHGCSILDESRALPYPELTT